MSMQRYIVAFFLAAAVVLALILRSAVAAVLLAIGVPDPLLGGAVPLSALVGVAGGVVGFLAGLRNRAAVTFISESIEEILKVTWPDREETVRSTMIVIGSAVGAAAFLFFADFVWQTVTRLLFWRT